MTDTIATYGDALTVEQVQRILVQQLTQASTFLATGPRIFDTDGSPVRLPKLTGSTAVGWTGEGVQIPEADVQFGEITLLPETMKSVKVLTKFTAELARQSVIALDAAIQQRLVYDVAAKLDNAFWAGDGGTADGAAGTEPVGVVNYSGTQAISSVGSITIDVLHDALGLAMSAHVDVASLRWALTPNVFTTLSKLKTTQGAYLLQPDPTQAGVLRLLGYPVTVTTFIPTVSGLTDVILFDPSQIAVARDMAPSVKLLDQTFADYDIVAIRVVARYDAAPMNPQAVVVMRGVTG